MAHEMLVGLDVLDEAQYQQYREAMKPILAQYEGGFGYDFKVSDVLKSPTADSINRVFTIYFSSSKNMDGFFGDPAYLKVKEQHFVGAVGSTTIISRYERS